MDVEVGSNLYRNTDGTIEIEGVPQLTLSLRPPTNSLLVNFALFDATGRVMAKIVDSNMTFNERRAYELTKSPTSVTLTHSESKKIVLHVEKKAHNLVVLNRGEFHTMRGRLFEVSSLEWRIDADKTSGASRDVAGGAVVIG
ncbi:MAG: hypothetical protein ACT4OO_06705 [Nitrospiraceae bacterium]